MIKSIVANSSSIILNIKQVSKAFGVWKWRLH